MLVLARSLPLTPYQCSPLKASAGRDSVRTIHLVTRPFKSVGFSDKVWTMETSEERKEEMEKMYGRMKLKSFPTVPAINISNLRELLEKSRRGEEKVVVVDTRSEGEMEVSMIPGGTLRARDFERRRDEFRDHKVVCYCTIGYRSGKYAQDLIRQNFNAFNLDGSILGWTHDGLPLTAEYDPEGGSAAVEEPNEGTRKVHVFSKDWCLQGDGYEAVWYDKKALPWPEVLWDQFRLILPIWLRGK